LEGLLAYQTLSQLYESLRLYQNFFQPSFKLAEKHRRGAQVTKRYAPPATPYERLLQAQNVPETTKDQLRALAVSLDPVKLLEEIHTLRARLAVIAKGERPQRPLPAPETRRAVLLTSVPVAQPLPEVRSADSVEAPAREQRPRETGAPPASGAVTPFPTHKRAPAPPPPVSVPTGAKVLPFNPLPPDRPLAHGLDPEFKKRLQAQQRECRRRHIGRREAFTLLWPQICRRLAGQPNLSASERKR